MDSSRNHISSLANLTGRSALITGGSGRLAFAFVSALAEAGASIALCDRESAGMTKNAQQVVQTTGAKVSTHLCDLSDEKAVRRLPDEVAAQHGHLDILVNNAAFVGTTAISGWAEPIESQSSEAWRAAMEVNVTAAFELVQATLPLLRESAHGSVINVASIYGLLGPDWSLYAGTKMANPAAYAASKGAIIQLTRWLATTLAPQIRVNCLSPGGIARGQPESFVAQYEARTPMKRMGVETDFKGAILFLASDLSSYVTGHNLVVDGGWSVW